MKLLLSSFFYVTLILAATTEAYSFRLGGSITSAFGGSVLITDRPSTTVHGPSIDMKKGKANVPAAMRTQYKRQQEMSQMREQMMEAQRPGPDGLPVFNLFVRSPRANMWYPCGSFKGDERSSALCSSWRDGGLLSGVSKKQLDTGVSGSLYRDKAKLVETICRGYTQLRKVKDELEFGYKLAYDGLSEEQQKITVIVPTEQRGFLDGVKSMFS